MFRLSQQNTLDGDKRGAGTETFFQLSLNPTPLQIALLYHHHVTVKMGKLGTVWIVPSKMQ